MVSPEVITRYRSSISLSIQPKFSTFTPETFKTTMDKQNFILSPGEAKTNMGQSFSIQAFSKGDLVVFAMPNTVSPLAPPQLIFQILNNFSLKKAFEGTIKVMLDELKLLDDSVAGIEVQCMTYVKASKQPVKSLSSNVKNPFLKELRSKISLGRLNIVSIKMATKFPITNDDLEIVVEPLLTDPEKEYFLSIHYKASSIESFNRFVAEYENDLIGNMIKTIER